MTKTSLDRLRTGAAKAAPAAAATRKRAKHERVTLTVRVDRPQWLLLREMADHRGVSLNELFLEGIALLRAREGLRPL